MAGTSSAQGAQSGAITSINITPLVDITLVLLIVFMVTAKIIVHRQALPVDLPRAASGEHTPEVFSAVILPDGSVQIDGRTLPDDEAVLDLARAALHRDAELRAVLQADGNVPHRRVMHLLDLLKQAGIAKVAFGVMPEAASPAPAR
jgi:biopolymer transport protein ExbD